MANIVNDATLASLTGLSLDASYKGDELQQLVAPILKLSPDVTSNAWTVLKHDADKTLALVHYTTETDQADSSFRKKTSVEPAPNVKHLRGVVVDLVRQCVVASSFGYTERFVGNRIEAVPNRKLFRAVDGVFIRVFKTRGTVYRVSYRSLNISRSRWSRSANFNDLYVKAGGPTDEELFDPAYENSSTCYHFVVTDPALHTATRLVDDRTLIYYVGQTIEGEADEETAPGKYVVPEAKHIEDIPDDVSKAWSQPEITVDEANDFLASGYWDTDESISDPRATTGESVISVLSGADGKQILTHIKSVAYDWRCRMRDDRPNLELLAAYNHNYAARGALEANKDMFIPFKVRGLSWKDVRELYEDQSGAGSMILYLETGESIEGLSYQNRVILVWLNLVFALSKSSQKTVLEYYEKFLSLQGKVASWIIGLEHDNFVAKTPFPEDLPKRVTQVISEARSSSGKGGRYGPVSTIESSICNFMRKERGESLYRLNNYMTRPKVQN